MSLFATLAQVTYNYNYAAPSSGPDIARLYAYSAPFLLLTIVGMWKTFVKAGRPGWAAIIPIYNVWVFFELAGKPGWWSLSMLIPIVDIIGLVLYIIALIEVNRRFGKSGAFALLLFFFPFIGYLMLGFGDAKYNGGEPTGNTFSAGTPPAPQI